MIEMPNRYAILDDTATSYHHFDFIWNVVTPLTVRRFIDRIESNDPCAIVLRPIVH